MKESIEDKKQELESLIKRVDQDLKKIDLLSNIIRTETKDALDKAIEETVNRVCDYFDVPVTDVYRKYGRRPPRQITKARRIISWTLCETANIPRSHIGNLYGKGWDHTSVNQHLEKIQEDLEFYRRKGKDVNSTIKYLTDLNIPIR